MSTPALPGMETSAEERANLARWLELLPKTDQLPIIAKLLRDLERLLAERDRAFAAGREAERAEIVAWLAEQRHTTTIAEWGKAFGLARLAIERGEHIPDAGNMVGQPSPDTGAR